MHQWTSGKRTRRAEEYASAHDSSSASHLQQRASLIGHVCANARVPLSLPIAAWSAVRGLLLGRAALLRGHEGVGSLAASRSAAQRLLGLRAPSARSYQATPPLRQGQLTRAAGERAGGAVARARAAAAAARACVRCQCRQRSLTLLRSSPLPRCVLPVLPTAAQRRSDSLPFSSSFPCSPSYTFAFRPPTGGSSFSPLRRLLARSTSISLHSSAHTPAPDIFPTSFHAHADLHSACDAHSMHSTRE